MNSPTKRQHDVLSFVVKFRAERGLSPSLSEIGNGVGIAKHTVLGHVQELEKKGLVTRKFATGRSILPTPAGLSCVPNGLSDAERWEKVAGWLHCWALLDSPKTERRIPSLEELFEKASS